ncbi:hypothetical protein [Flagellimonas nanhaiensis]|uniref:Uncharacterized protein n=1 Tax=Flagellimonas nanhaiensis TaxID=2292706 RepID=A0A371JL89_9FLAO|nr:hypothetical protein [Allomuricauda nanhaiensis]RDY57734.1 hypothetical protein DX873_17705 [Allomuricauda nanhaiensis]
MSEYVFRNHSRKSLRIVLVEIGEYRLREAFRKEFMLFPSSMNGFYMEYDMRRNFFLYFKGEDSQEPTLMMKINAYYIPKDGWELFGLRRNLDNRGPKPERTGRY